MLSKLLLYMNERLEISSMLYNKLSYYSSPAAAGDEKEVHAPEGS